jgi:hypothetical protein
MINFNDKLEAAGGWIGVMRDVVFVGKTAYHNYIISYLAVNDKRAYMVVDKYGQVIEDGARGTVVQNAKPAEVWVAVDQNTLATVVDPSTRRTLKPKALTGTSLDDITTKYYQHYTGNVTFTRIK